MVILDAMEKAAGVRVLQAELNDQPGVCLKLTGALADAGAAAEAAASLARGMGVSVVARTLPNPSNDSKRAYAPAPDFNSLIEQASIHRPREMKGPNGENMSEQAGFAIGLIETQGFAAVIEAIDTALKTAAVEVLAREKLGGGYITVVIKGDVAAVRAAVEAGSARVNGLGKLIAAHVISSPSTAVLALLPATT